MAVLTEKEVHVLNELKSSQFGIVKKLNATAIRRDSRALVIGLGGMGVGTICKLKRELKRRIGEIDPQYMRFVAIDTAAKELNELIADGVLTEAECAEMSSDVLTKLAGAPTEFIPPTIRKINRPDFKPNLDGNGANQIRLSGRISIMDPEAFERVHSKIKNAITEMGKYAHEKLEVYIISGTGGGSGSGLIIDIPYIVRQIFTGDLSLDSTRMSLFGYIYLPNSYKGIVSNYDKAEANGYAALKEVDYYMNIAELGETYDAFYPGIGGQNFNVSCSHNIFDFCTLIGGTAAANVVIKNPIEYAHGVCVENIINQVTRVVAMDGDDAGKTGSQVFTSDSFKSNSDSALQTIFTRENDYKLPRNANYKYACIGATALRFPDMPITEYVVGTVYKNMTDMLVNNIQTLNQAEVEAFERAVGLSFATIYNQAWEKFNFKFEKRIEDYTISKSSIQRGSMDLLTLFNADLATVIAELPSKDTLLEMCQRKAVEAADLIFKNPAKGPFYLEKLLTADTAAGDMVMGYFQLIDRYSKQVSEIDESNKRNAAQYEAAKRQREQNIPLILNKSWKDTYLDTIKSIYRCKVASMVAEKLHQYYGVISNRIGVCYDLKTHLEQNEIHFAELIKKTSLIMEKNVEDNYNNIFSDKKEDLSDSIFAIEEQEIRELKFAMRQHVEDKIKYFDREKTSFFAGRLLNDMITRKNVWRLKVVPEGKNSESCDALRELIREYPDFSDIIDNSFTGYFDIAYGGKSEEYKKTVAHVIIKNLTLYSAPSFNVWPSFYFDSVSELAWCFMILPETMNKKVNDISWTDRFGMAMTDLNAKNKNVMISPDGGAMYYYTMYVRMPMFLHKDLMDYEQKYVKFLKFPGIHIDESEACNPPIREYPPLFVKESWDRATEGGLNYVNEMEVEYRNKLAKDYAAAKARGLVAVNPMDQQYRFVFANLPYVGNDIDSDKISTFAAKFVAKHAEELNSEGLLVKAYEEFCSEYGATYNSIPNSAFNHMTPDSDENAVKLLRKAMRLTKKMRDYIALLDKFLFMPIEQKATEGAKMKTRALYINCILYNLITKNAVGAWVYKRGGEQQITSKIQLNADVALKKLTQKLEIIEDRTGDAISVADLMEFASYKKFTALADVEDVSEFLQTKLENVAATLSADEMLAVKESAEKYSKKAGDVKKIYDTKITQLGYSSAAELGPDAEVYEFYAELCNESATLLEAFE